MPNYTLSLPLKLPYTKPSYILSAMAKIYNDHILGDNSKGLPENFQCENGFLGDEKITYLTIKFTHKMNPQGMNLWLQSKLFDYNLSGIQYYLFTYEKGRVKTSQNWQRTYTPQNN